MTKEIWLNLPAKGLTKTKAFFSKIGFTLNEKQSNDRMIGFTVGEKSVAVMFVAEDTFKEFAKNEISDTSIGSELLISFDAEGREAVDEMARKVFEAGGTIFAEPAEIQGWMYGFAFSDPNGHRWNQVFMDFGKLPQN